MDTEHPLLPTSQARCSRRWAGVPVIGVVTGVGLLFSGTAGRAPTRVAADMPGASTTYLHFHQYANDGSAAANAQGAPWATVQNSVVHSHGYTQADTASGDPAVATGASAQGAPWATISRISVDHPHSVNHTHSADHWHGGYHDHYDNWHTNKYRKYKYSTNQPVNSTLYCYDDTYVNCTDFNCWGTECGYHQDVKIDATYYWRYYSHWDTSLVRSTHAHKYSTDGDCPPDTCYIHKHKYTDDGSAAAVTQGAPWATIHVHSTYADNPPATSHTHTLTQAEDTDGAQGAPYAYDTTVAANHTHTSTIGVWHTHQDVAQPQPS